MLLLALSLAALQIQVAEGPGQSVHGAHMAELEAAPPPVTEDELEARRLEQVSTGRVAGRSGAGTRASVMEKDRIVFGYLQSETQVYHMRWHALTHVGSRFVGFDQNGNLTGTSAFTGRSSYLRAGGAADLAGVKMILVLANFDDGVSGDIAQVMTQASRRATLVSQLVSVVANDSYAHGISLDLEFSWGATVRDGISAFCRELRAALDAVDPELELSIYTNAIFSSSQWDFDPVTGITPSIDYMLYSMYDWASGSSARAISDFDNCLASGRMYRYLQDGLPPEKLVPVLSAYSRRWNGVSSYGQAGSSPLSGGFADARYDTTLRPGIGPAAERYVRGDEAGWYAYVEGGTPRVRTFEALKALELEVRHTLSAIDPSGEFAGRRLGGIGFWSLLWMAEFTSVDPRNGQTVARTRTYPHIYQLVQEAYAPPQETRRYLETFAGLDFRWRDPNESPDTSGDTNLDSFRAHLPVAPAGGVAGGMRFGFDFEGAAANRAVFAHEVLAHPDFPTIRDTNAVLGHLRVASRLEVTAVNETALPGYSARLLVIDGDGELEASRAFPLDVAGPLTLRWNLAGGGLVDPFTTSEPGFQSGDGVLDTDRSQADIGVFGVVVEGNGPAAGALLLDDITYRAVSPTGGAYTINEVRYGDPSGEFVEVHGPSGPLPFGFELRVFDPTDGGIEASFPLSGSMPGSVGARGVLAFGDPSVPGVSGSVGFADGRDDLRGGRPLALQLWDGVNQHAHDSVVFEALGGFDELARLETAGVGGGALFGEVASGLDGNGARHSAGRLPGGRRGGARAPEISLQVATPGLANTSSPRASGAYDFESPPPTAWFQTFNVPRRSSPEAAGLPRSADGGLAWRVVDPSGGGVIGRIGDGRLGGSKRGLRVSGQLYVPGGADPAVAVGVGICGVGGSDFFGPASEGFESGYWLIWENNPGVGLADGRPDHPAAFELVHATHDGRDEDPVDLMAVASDLILGVTPGTWTDFSFHLAPEGAPGPELEVRVNDRLVYAGALPEGGPRSGAVQVGFRENHPGGPLAREGAWVDGLRIEPAVPTLPGLDRPR